MAAVTVTRLPDGGYRIEHDEGSGIVYTAGPLSDCWVHWKGDVFRGDFRDASGSSSASQPRRQTGAAASIHAPMPARVARVLAAAGTLVRKGDTLIVLEAMKMELPLRAPADATVAAVRCGEGDLVQAGAVLMDLA